MSFRSLHDRHFLTHFPFGEDGRASKWEAAEKWGSGLRLYDAEALSKSGVPVPAHTTILDDRKSIAPVSLTRPLNATGRNMDDAYAYLASKGIKVILNPTGAFANQILDPRINASEYGKQPPLDKDADPNKVESYLPYALLYQQDVLRWGPDQNPDLENVYQHPTNAWFSTPPGTGRNTVWGFQAVNEKNWPFSAGKGGVTLTMFQCGVGWAVTYVKGREASPNARLIAPSFLAATADKLQEFIAGFKDGLDQLENEAGALPIDYWSWHPSFHRYHREGNQGQTQVNSDKGASPESVDASDLYDAIVAVCDEHGTLPPMLTETGYNDDPRESASKQRAPLQEGLSLGESKAVLAIRNLILARAAGIDTVCEYHVADDFGGGWEDLVGFFHGSDGSHPDDPGKPYYSEKQAFVFWDNWMTSTGKLYDVPKQQIVKEDFEGVQVITVSAVDKDGNTGTLKWSDAKNVPGVANVVPVWRADGGVVEPPEPPGTNYPLEMEFTTPDGSCFLVPARVKPEKA